VGVHRPAIKITAYTLPQNKALSTASNHHKILYSKLQTFLTCFMMWSVDFKREKNRFLERFRHKIIRFSTFFVPALRCAIVVRTCRAALIIQL
jgi:hypothetical protein